jgi:hypothetical protein
VLKPAGRFLAVDFGATPSEGIGHVLCVLGLRKGWDHAERLREMIREAGFDAVEMGPLGIGPWPSCAAGRRPWAGLRAQESSTR